MELEKKHAEIIYEISQIASKEKMSKITDGEFHKLIKEANSFDEFKTKLLELVYTK